MSDNLSKKDAVIDEIIRQIEIAELEFCRLGIKPKAKSIHRSNENIRAQMRLKSLSQLNKVSNSAKILIETIRAYSDPDSMVEMVEFDHAAVGDIEF
jgi:hypothetical protein